MRMREEASSCSRISPLLSRSKPLYASSIQSNRPPGKRPAAIARAKAVAAYGIRSVTNTESPVNVPFTFFEPTVTVAESRMTASPNGMAYAL